MKSSFKRFSLLLALVLSIVPLFTACQSTAPAPANVPQSSPAVETVSDEQEAVQKPAPAPYTYADTIAWDGCYDVVVVGFGGAGAVAAKTAADEGANVLLLEKAPEGHEGGNTRYCGQLWMYGHEDYEATLAYLTALQGNRTYSQPMLEVYAEGIAGLRTTLEEQFGTDPTTFADWGTVPAPSMKMMSPEYPELPGSDRISLCTVQWSAGDSHLWQIFRQHVAGRSDKIDVWFESPATRLIQDPETKTILGVELERGGETLRIRANNGVIMTCGGFENNPEMVECYLGIAKSAAIGTLYNTGDGVRMVMEVGAGLWHMDVYEGDGIGAFGGVSYVVEEGERAVKFDHSDGAGNFDIPGSYIFVGADGSRYLREDEVSRHGHIYQCGNWDNPKRPTRSFLVYDSVYAEKMDAKVPEQFKTQILCADTLGELAELCGMNAEILSASVSNYNSFAKTGVDLQYGRSADTMVALSGSGPYYALELIPAILNTQGGPRRNENAEILGADGNPIPHLYAAGEFGGITGFMYQGGGNIAECIIFGQIAGRNAAAEKDALPKYTASGRVDSSFTYVPGVLTDLGTGFDASGFAENELLGVSHNGMGGDLYVKVTMDGDAIAQVEVVEQKETEGIGDKAIEALPAKIVEAQSIEVDNISGATITSKAIKEAVENALSQTK